MHTPGETEIARSKTIDDWKALRATLIVGKKERWDEAFTDFLHARLRSRYLEPIETLRKSGKERGEGFAIVAIQCTLIEFLASTVEGKSYTPDCKKLGPHKYSRSGQLVKDFLTKNQPFRSVFGEKLASDFYYSVRCGLIHEARTRNDWIISARRPPDAMINADDKIVNRNRLQDAIVAFIDSYGRDLPSERSLQEAFIRKFDSLCR